MPVSTLKKTRIDAQLADISRVKWRANYNSNTISGAPSKAQTKMEKRLEPLAPLLVLLPKPLSIQFKEFTTLILSHKIEITHCEKRTQFTELNPDHYQSSIPNPKFELTCKAEFVDNNEFKTLRDKAKQSILDMKIVCNQ